MSFEKEVEINRARQMVRNLTPVLRDLALLEKMTCGHCHLSRQALSALMTPFLLALPAGTERGEATALFVGDLTPTGEEPTVPPKVWLVEHQGRVLPLAFASELAADVWLDKHQEVLSITGNARLTPTLVTVRGEKESKS
jgi:hypothetical protein